VEYLVFEQRSEAGEKDQPARAEGLVFIFRVFYYSDKRITARWCRTVYFLSLGADITTSPGLMARFYSRRFRGAKPSLSAAGFEGLLSTFHFRSASKVLVRTNGFPC